MERLRLKGVRLPDLYIMKMLVDGTGVEPVSRNIGAPHRSFNQRYTYPPD